MGNIQKINNSINKHVRILNMVDFIFNHMVFLDKSEYSAGSDYDKMMKEFTSYLKNGESLHDDAADGISGLAYFCKNWFSNIFR
jgi:hypothetical protein